MIDVIVVIGTFDMSPAERAGFVAQRADQIALSRSEDGCLDYAPSLDAYDPGRVRLIERWTTSEALAAHVAAIQERGGPPSTIRLIAREVTIVEGEVRSFE